jgi:outer membrane immunogenic protein
MRRPSVKKLLWVAGALLASASVSFAGDLPIQRRPNYVQQDIATSLFNWSGFYVGGNAGYGWGSAIGGDPSGFLGGFQAGYNFQVSPRAVFGFETDISFTSIDDTSGAAKFGVDYLGTLRARVGYSVDRVMFYVTGGAAYGQGQLDVGGLSNKQFHWGWTLGAGVEAAVTQNVSAKVEYLYVDLSDQTYQSILGPRSVGYNTSLIRGGLNYRF